MTFRLNLPRILMVAACSFLLVSCDKTDEKDPLVVPSAYDGATFAANTTGEATLLSGLDQLAAEMKKGRTTGVQVDLTTLHNLYNAYFLTTTSSYYRDQISSMLPELVKASGNTYVPGQAGEGGVYGGYLFDENGLEYEQLVQKGLFGAALYNQAIAIMQHFRDGGHDAHKLVKLFGATPAFKNSDNATKHAADADKYQAAYAARRDKNDGNGLYTSIHAQFRKLQAAALAGSDYNAERDQALAEIQLLWEKANAATVINYAHAATSLLSATNPTDVQKASALHALGESIGFLHGWRGLDDNYRLITNQQIDTQLELLLAPAGGQAEVYKFATESVAQLPRLQTLIANLQAIYGFSDQDVEDFKHNWVSEQGR